MSIRHKKAFLESLLPLMPAGSNTDMLWNRLSASGFLFAVFRYASVYNKHFRSF